MSTEDLAGGRDPAEVFLVLQGEDADDTLLNWEFLTPAKTCPLPRATIAWETRADGDLTEIRLTADRPAFHVWLEIPGRRGVFSDNAFLLLPGREKKVTFTPRDGRGAVEAKGIVVTQLRDTY
jgi:hypothetical protein